MPNVATSMIEVGGFRERNISSLGAMGLGPGGWKIIFSAASSSPSPPCLWGGCAPQRPSTGVSAAYI